MVAVGWRFAAVVCRCCRRYTLVRWKLGRSKRLDGETSVGERCAIRNVRLRLQLGLRLVVYGRDFVQSSADRSDSYRHRLFAIRLDDQALGT